MLRVRFASGVPAIEVRLWNGEALASAGDAIGRVWIKSRKVLLKLARNPSLAFARAYASGEIEIEGDLVATMCAALRSDLARKRPPWFSLLRRVLLRNSIRRARRNAAAHYDLGNEFYRLWLDETMTYSGAVFPDASAALDAAQRAKCGLICRKLDLQPGERFLDIGCGWGHLALHAAREYGAKSLGITLSEEQQRYASEWAARLGLQDRCRIELRDYRQIDGTFDKIASVGMLEHAGRANLGRFFHAVAKALRPGGRCVIQTIGQHHPEAVSGFGEAVFPGGYIPTGSEILCNAEKAGLEWRHADNLAEHYALTLSRWRQNFESARREVERLKGRWFARWWEFYLAASEAAFRVGRLQLYQILFTKGFVPLPLGRAFASI